MSTINELLAKWQARRVDPLAARGLVPLGDIAGEVLADLEALAGAEADQVLSLTEASVASGYSVDWLQKQVAKGAIPNAGRRGKPGIRRADLPRRPGRPLPSTPRAGQFAGRRRIVLDARPTTPGATHAR